MFVFGPTGGFVAAVVGLATTVFVASAVGAAAVNVATICVLAPAASGPMFAQFSVPSLLLSADAGTEDPYVRYAVS